MVLVMMIARTITVTTMRTCRGMKPRPTTFSIIVCALSPRASPQKSMTKTKNFSAQFQKPFKQLKKFPKADSPRLAFSKNSLGLAIFENVSPLSLWIFVEMQSHVFAKPFWICKKLKIFRKSVTVQKLANYPTPKIPKRLPAWVSTSDCCGIGKNR